MSRAKDFENAVAQYLDLKRYSYISSKNQSVRCIKCGQHQQVRTQGWDFAIFSPREAVSFIEVKTGTGRLTKPQKEWQAKCLRLDIPYYVVRDTIDSLVKEIR